MATTKKLVIEFATDLGKTKSFSIKNPKNGITRAQAENFVTFLYDESIIDNQNIGNPGELTKAYYEETTTTDLT